MATDAYDGRGEQRFPRLDDAQIARVAGLGVHRRVARGELLIEQDEVNTRFFIILRGAVEIVQPRDGHEDLIVVLEPGQFTGEINMVSAHRSLVRARVRDDGEVLELERAALRRLVQADFELSEILMRAFILRRMSLISQSKGEVVVVGSRFSAGTLRVREFLGRNGEPYSSLEVDSDPRVQELLDRFGVTVADVPVVICNGRTVLRNPSNEEVAECLGWSRDLDEARVRDLVVVGAGPAGLAAAVYAASEGLDVLVLEGNAPGGQAGSSSKIENYLGFPTGISGEALAARAHAQAQKFGAEIAIARRAAKLDCARRPYTIAIEHHGAVRARAVIIASGVQYRRLPIDNLSRFEGTGVYYGATHLESQVCGGDEIVVVGGGNSAGQAAVFLAQTARHVHVLVRADGLAGSMSRYLISRIEENPKITLHTRCEIEALDGEHHLERVRWRDRNQSAAETHDIRHLFLMTGATPNTKWLHGCVALDDKGFVKTGPELAADDTRGASWPGGRAPFLLETSRPGIFAVGDVRSNNVKRVASAVGEGSVCIQLVHKALQE